MHPSIAPVDFLRDMKDISNKYIQLLQSWRPVCGFLPPVALGVIHVWLFQSQTNLFLF